MNCSLRKEFINKNAKIIMKRLLMEIHTHFLHFTRSCPNPAASGPDFLVVNSHTIDIL